MAKGNLFLGTARRKVGDVVLYRRNGQQVSRVRVRSISNPRTEGQATQRVFFGEVSKFYSPLAVTLEQSWEGRNRSESADAFRAAALRDVRAQGVYVPKSLGFVPLPVMLSYGSLPSVPILYCEAEEVLSMVGNSVFEGETIGALSNFFISAGLAEEGDQVTFVCASQSLENTNVFVPVVGRFIIAAASTVALGDALPRFYFESHGTFLHVSALVANHDPAALGVIVSRYSNGAWRRSTSRLVLYPDLLENLQSDDQRRISIESYMNGGSTVTSDVYLNGGEYATGSEVAETITLADGRTFSPTSINYDNGVAMVTGNVNGSTIASAYVTIGSDYLLTATTKGALPSGAPAITGRLDGNNDLVRSWLQTNGVAASVWSSAANSGD